MPSFKVSTNGFNDIIDITKKVEKIVEESRAGDGIVLVFVTGSTAGITIIEYEKGVIEDLKNIFEKIVPQKAKYSHEEAWQNGNGFSHVRAGILGPSLTVPIENGKILLGIWQRIVLIDFDAKPRERKVIVKIIKSI